MATHPCLVTIIWPSIEMANQFTFHLMKEQVFIFSSSYMMPLFLFYFIFYFELWLQVLDLCLMTFTFTGISVPRSSCLLITLLELWLHFMWVMASNAWSSNKNHIFLNIVSYPFYRILIIHHNLLETVHVLPFSSLLEKWTFISIFFLFLLIFFS